MIEKRFESDGWKITDAQNNEDIGMIKASELLNKLAEENEQLKQELNSLRKSIREIIQDYHKLKTDDKQRIE